MDPLYWVLGGTVLIILWGIFFLLKRKSFPPLSHHEIEKWSQKIQDTKHLNPAHSILEVHKIFIRALNSDDEKKTAVEILRKYESRIGNMKQIWKWHRLRNKIAHEVEITISIAQAQKAREDFIRALNFLGK